MQKTTIRSRHYLARSGSYSTHASPTGRNLLGWDAEEEQMTPQQQLEACQKHIRRLHEQMASPSISQDQRAQLGERLEIALEQLRPLRDAVNRPGKREKKDLTPFIAQAIQERMNKHQWERLVQEARELMRRDALEDKSKPAALKP